MKFGIGDRPSRVEDSKLLRGAGRYSDDVASPGALHGVVLRATRAHADVVRLDASTARTLPGVHAVLTPAELEEDGVGDIHCLAPVKNRDGSEQAKMPWEILARGRVRYAGAPVAFVVAETLEQAKDAAEAVEVDYADLPVETDTRGALRPGAHPVWEHVPGNLVFDYFRGDEAAVEAAFAEAHRVVRLELVNNRLVSNAMEPRAVLAEVDGTRIRLHAPSQGPSFMKGQLCGMLGLPEDALRITTGNVGGGFGTKAFLYPETCLTVWAAKRLGRSVRWTGDRSEIFLSDAQGRDNVTEAELALDGEGRFLALRATTCAAMGAHLSNFGPLIPTDAAVGMYTGLYRIPAFCVTVKGVATNTVPTDAYRGAGRPEAAYLIERLVDAAARETGLAPDEIRRRNLPTAEELPFTMALGDVIDSGDFAGVMDRAMEVADWPGFEARRAASAAGGRLRGLGMATYVERCAGGGGAPADIRFAEDGAIELLMGTLDSGQGHAIAYAQILSAKLGLDVERVRLVQGDTDRTPPGFTGGSKSIPVGGASVSFAADKVIDKALELGAHVLEAARADVEYREGGVAVAGTDRFVDLWDLAEIARDPARLPEGMAPGLDADHDHTAEAPTFPNGCHICELEVDRDTGRIEILAYTVVDDFGVALNPTLLEGQVHGGVVQGLGQAWAERTVYDAEAGQLLSGSFMDYRLLRADDLPNFTFETRNTPCATNPLGVKGAGEAGAIGAPPAFINALVDALHAETGVAHIDMPATPLAVWSALRARDEAA